MSTPSDNLPPEEQIERIALTRAEQSLRLVSANLPHLSGLARIARLKVSREVSVAAVSASGLVLVNPQIYASVPLLDATFVMAHELMHLALDTHGRQGDSQPLLVNFAHDYVINDMLADELGREPPLHGLFAAGAKERSLEEWVTQLRQHGDGGSLACWDPRSAKRRGPSTPGAGNFPLRRAMQDAGIVPHDAPVVIDPSLTQGDVIPENRERDFEPHIDEATRGRLRERVRREAAKAASLGALRQQIAKASQSSDEPERGEALMRAVRKAYDTPWERALQRWVDAIAPGERTYARPSRRRHARRDVVLPGRRRDGWALHILLDTSGSMVDILPQALGAIGFFAEGAGVSQVHVVQCDVVVTHDDWVEPEKLEEFRITGFGYSDMSPGMLHLSEDPEVQAALVLTDGYISYPAEEPHYRVLWGLIGQFDESFAPPYGEVMRMID